EPFADAFGISAGLPVAGTRGAGLAAPQRRPLEGEARQRFGGGTYSEPVHEQVQAQPHNVDEVPVPGGAFEAEVVVGGEVAARQANQDDRQHGGAHDDVETVEAGQHVEQRAVHARAELQVQFGDGVVVFVGLAGHEDEAQQNGG